MKKQIIIACVALLGLYSCDKDDELRIVSNAESSQALVKFAQSGIDFPVDIDTDNFNASKEITIEVSTVSSVDRTYNVSVDADASTADPANYRIENSVTVPANSYTGTFTIEGQDTTLETTAETIVINLAPQSDLDVIEGSATISIFQVCPIPPTYMVGDYEISDNQIVFSGTNFSTRIVDIQVGESSTQRTFRTDWSGGPDFTVVLNLVCNELIWASENRTGFTGGGEPIIIVPASDNDSTYDLSDDSFFIVEYDNIAGSFGTFEGSVFLIKQ